MKKSAVLILALIILLCMPLIAHAKSSSKDDEAKAKGDMAELDSRVTKFRDNVKSLQENLDKEINERDRLMLQKRFVAGKEFYFMLEDYRDAAEIFWGIVLHPEAQKFPRFNEALYYLAESLFNIGYYFDSKIQYQRLAKRGSGDPYFALALMRLIEISIAQSDYNAAEKYYGRLLAEAPAGTDSSLGQYLIGKSYVIRGNHNKAFSVLDSIPAEASYHAIAQYYMAVLEVKSRKYDAAVVRLKKLKAAFKNENIAHKQDVYALTHLSLGRLLYETNDFPQAISQYFSVPPESPYYPEALYESMWVISTRNDFLLKKVSDEDTNYTSLVNDYSFIGYGLDREKDLTTVSPLQAGMDDLEPDISEMNDLLKKIDERLSTLQKEAVKSYKNLVTKAPGSPDLPEAEMLLGGIYAQVNDFEKAEQWYNNAQSKYSRFSTQVRNAKTRFENDTIAVQAVQAGNTPTNQPLPDTMRLGVPAEITYWLAADNEVKKTFTLFEGAQKARKNLQYMQQLLGQIESELRTLESGVGFPILKQTHRRLNDLRTESSSIDSFLSTVEMEVEAIEDTEEKQALKAQFPSYRNTISQGRTILDSVERKVEQKKREKIAAYRQDFRSLSAPIAQYAEDVSRLYAEATDYTATAARSSLDQVERKLYDVVLQAKIGLVETAWKNTEGSSDEVKKLQRDMEEEIRKFRRQLRGGEPIESGE